MKMYHNPRCRKSREALQILQEKGVDVEIVEYLKEPPSAKELKATLKKMGVKPMDIIRKNEQIFRDNFKGKEYSDEEWIDILTKNPKLIERPIAIEGDRAVVGRPPEKVLELV